MDKLKFNDGVSFRADARKVGCLFFSTDAERPFSFSDLGCFARVLLVTTLRARAQPFEAQSRQDVGYTGRNLRIIRPQGAALNKYTVKYQSWAATYHHRLKQEHLAQLVSDLVRTISHIKVEYARTNRLLKSIEESHRARQNVGPEALTQVNAFQKRQKLRAARGTAQRQLTVLVPLSKAVCVAVQQWNCPAPQRRDVTTVATLVLRFLATPRPLIGSRGQGRFVVGTAEQNMLRELMGRHPDVFPGMYRVYSVGKEIDSPDAKQALYARVMASTQLTVEDQSLLSEALLGAREGLFGQVQPHRS